METTFDIAVLERTAQLAEPPAPIPTALRGELDPADGRMLRVLLGRAGARASERERFEAILALVCAADPDQEVPTALYVAGPNPAMSDRHFSGGPTAALMAMSAAALELEAADAPAIRIAAVETIGPDRLRAHQGASARDGTPTPVMAEGAAGLLLGRADDQRPGPRARMAVARAEPDEPWPALITRTLARLDLGPSEIAQILSASPVPTDQERTGARAALGEIADSLVHLAWRCGNAGAVLSLYGIIAALEELCPTLLLTHEPSLSTATAIVPYPAPTQTRDPSSGSVLA